MNEVKPKRTGTIHRYALAGALVLLLACDKKDDKIARMIDESAARHEADRRETERRAEAARAASPSPREPRPQTFDERKREIQMQLGRDACKRLAKETDDCNAGKPCKQTGVEDMKACASYMGAKGLDKNPF